MEKADIGLIGLGVMGQNLALNLADKGWKVVVWNRTVPGKEENVVDNFIANRAKGKGIIGSNELTDFVEALKAPRVILLMVQAGPAVDELMGKLLPLLDKGDILIDEVVEIVGCHIFPDCFCCGSQSRVGVQQMPFACVRALLHLFCVSIFLLHVQVAEGGFHPIFGSRFHKA